MTHPWPRDLVRRQLEPLLASVDRNVPIGARVEALTDRLRGRPYAGNPLGGSADTAEVLTISLAAFDCVTFVETVLALATTREPERFVERVRRLRYQGGRVAWRRRHHYATDWIRGNVRAGFVSPVLLRARAVTRARRLSVLAGLPARRVQVRCVPKRPFWRARDEIRTGDLVFFASTRPVLDVFHQGIVVRRGEGLRLRHASRSRGKVVDQDLAAFLEANRMAGVLVARPRETS
jgi:hypothetical protein